MALNTMYLLKTYKLKNFSDWISCTNFVQITRIPPGSGLNFRFLFLFRKLSVLSSTSWRSLIKTQLTKKKNVQTPWLPAKPLHQHPPPSHTLDTNSRQYKPSQARPNQAKLALHLLSMQAKVLHNRTQQSSTIWFFNTLILLICGILEF